MRVYLPFYEGWFLSSLRRNRQSFVLGYLAVSGIMVIVEIMLIFFEASQRPGFLIHAAFYIPAVIAHSVLIIQRLHDLDMSGWFLLAFPFIAVLLGLEVLPTSFGFVITLAGLIALAVAPGSKANNRYGDAPL